MSLAAARLAAEGIPGDRESLISFPGGDTPLGMVEAFTAMVNDGTVDITRTRYVSLDEWVGLTEKDAGSCGRFNFDNLINKMKVPFLEYHIINGKAPDMNEECRRLDGYIVKYGPLDVSVLGIGMNGHLGFNEEGVDFSLNAHVTPLSATTKSVMGKYFSESLDLEYGITQGIAQIMAARKAVLIANGSHKADILYKAFRGPVTNAVPASILQEHPNCYVVADEKAAAKLRISKNV
ncbi:glucosamine-6-phosphate deaminase [Breznakiella homolactica]|uniref:Glucosamine-6-phosphate deaminase n=1 Tax=Breznakiella homolactica TaxID=2798577 RepID=A0A7T7XML2_9SPIR|nr:glucosamine-6-phosphate deaminase [Breznakiella homolactica]QQO09134.1 glucosamine-6-phosphate deaminase [Breznakiella homolactica]